MKIPATIVTGALGAGKTTFVNNILTKEHGYKIGVIVNEYGEIGIDGDLILASKEKLIELPNGCICCEVREDLLEAITKLLNTNKIDYLLIETSGLAEVIPIAMTFTQHEIIDKTELDSVICIADAENYYDNIKRNKTATEQIQTADIILLNKADLVDKKTLEEIKKDITKLTKAQIIETTKGKAPLELLLGIKKFDTNKHLEWNKKQHEHAHNTGVDTYSTKTGPVDPDKFEKFWENLPHNIYRAKAIVCIKESKKGQKDELRIAFHKVGKRWEMEFTRPWQTQEKKETKAVFIGTKIDKKKIEEGLKKCD